MAGFNFKKHLLGADNPAMAKFIIANSQTITVGDAVKMASGFVQVCGANDRPMGIVAGIVDKNGIDLNSTVADNFDGTFTRSTNTYVATSDNQTDKQVAVLVIADPYAVFENVADAAMTTAMIGQHFSLVDEDAIDGDTNAATVGEFVLWDLPDADDLTKGLFSISMWQFSAAEPET